MAFGGAGDAYDKCRYGRNRKGSNRQLGILILSQVSVYSSRGLSDDERKRKNLLRGIDGLGWGSVVSKNIIGVLCVIYGYVM